MPETTVSYKNAPLSELICGVIFHDNILIEKSILFEMISELSKNDYPTITTTPAIFEEEPIAGRLALNMNYEKTGFSAYRLISSDKKWMLQLQQNFILLNWIRQDDQIVGQYPGFNTVYERFKAVIDLAKKKFVNTKTDIDFYKQIKTYTLTYQDRISWQSYIDNFSNIEKILKLNIPNIPEADGIDNISIKYTLPFKEIGGYGVMSINSAIIPPNNNLLIIECRIKGKYEGDRQDDWFKKANEIQVKSFENIIQSEILSQWKH